MQTMLPGISAEALNGLASALRAGRLAWPPSAISLKANEVAGGAGLLEALKALAVQFPTAEQGAAVLSMLAAERAAAESAAQRRVELVWSGPDGKGQTRDTAITIRELFATVQRKVLMSTYNVGGNEKLFALLVEKVQRDPTLEVTIFVNINRKLLQSKMREGENPVEAFRRWFVDKHWRTARLPAVYYDPRAMRETYEDQETKKWVYPPDLHAKCIIVDDEIALVTSANFSDAAQNDNIEAGVLVRDPRFAQALTQQFVGLVARKEVERVF